MPKVSVVIPAYNAASFIQEAVDSVLNQTYKDYEIIVVDDGSTDNTKVILSLYAEKIRYIHKENGGVSSALNLGIKSSKGEYIAILAADDMWFPAKLEMQIRKLDENPDIGLVCSDARYVRGKKLLKSTHFMLKTPFSGHIFRELLIRNFISAITVVARKKCFEDVGLFDENLVVSEDHDMWLRIAKHFKIDYVKEPLALVRIHGNSLSRNEIRLQEGNLRVVRKALEEDRGLLKILEPEILGKVYYSLFKRLGMLYLRKGENAKAKKSFLEYIGHDKYKPEAYVLLLWSYLPRDLTKLCWNLLRSASRNKPLSLFRYNIYGHLFTYDPSWCRFSDEMTPEQI